MPDWSISPARPTPTDAEQTLHRDRPESTERAEEDGNWRDEDPSNTIAKAIAAREEVEVAQMPPLYGSVDTEGLDAVLQSTPEVTVTFTHYGFSVTVTGRGELELERRQEP